MTSPMSAPSNAVVSDRSAGTVVAAAAGDALGAPHEFGRPPSEVDRLGIDRRRRLRWKPGEWTDDTQMSLAVLTPLAAGDGGVGAVQDGFLASFASGPHDVGSRTVRSFGSVAAVKAAAKLQGSNPEGARNGGLMRIGPAGIRSLAGPSGSPCTRGGVTELTSSHTSTASTRARSGPSRSTTRSMQRRRRTNHGISLVGSRCGGVDSRRSGRRDGYDSSMKHANGLRLTSQDEWLGDPRVPSRALRDRANTGP